jgi:hypothetical protein
MLDLNRYRELIDEHRRWLGSFDPQHSRNWEKLLDADREAAMSEASIRRLLQQNKNRVEPNEDLAGLKQTPDFRCGQTGKTFFVEVACIKIDTATEITGLSPRPLGQAQNYADLNKALFGACIRKTPQCSGLEQPALVAVCTFHWQATMLCFRKQKIATLLTGSELITYKWDSATGAGYGEAFLTTKLQKAAFIKPADNSSGMAHARNPVSAMLACGLGGDHARALGILHPLPVYEFDRAMLPDVAFCRLCDGYQSGKLSTEWI